MSSANGKINPVLLVVGTFVWLLACWIWPVIQLRDKETTANMKTMWSGWLIIAGVGPIVLKAWDVYNTQGSAVSNKTGGNAPPGTNVEPNLATVKIGSETGQQRINGFPGGAAT